MKIKERDFDMGFKKTEGRRLRQNNLTIPNAMSLFRIVVIPFFAYFFLTNNLPAAVLALALSGLSDALDGFVARRFNQITELGKMLDPFADKLTQGTVAVCIAIRYPAICPLLFLLVVKELVMLCGAVFLLRRGRKPCASKWYGKVSTTLFYVSIALIVVMDGFMQVPAETFTLVSNIALVVTAAFMLYTFVRYFAIFRQILRDADDHQYDINLPEELWEKKQKS